MPDNLSDIVQITITKESTAIDTASFNIPLILTDTVAFAERTRQYSSISSVMEDFGSDSAVYTIATRLFGDGSTRTPYIIVGRRQAETATYSVSNVEVGEVYTLTINGQGFSYTAELSDTDVEIADGIAEAYLLAPIDDITVTASGGVVQLDTSSDEVTMVVSGSGSLEQDTITSGENWAETIAAVEGETDVWYGVVATTHEPSEVLSIATAIQARRKIFGTSTQDPAALSTNETDIGSQLSAFNYDRTFWVYSPFADEDYPEAAWMGSQLPMTPGSNTWNFKQATGVRAGRLTDTQKVNIRNKNGNMYTRRAGVDIFEDGVMADGEFIDIIVGIDWWYARVQEAIFFRLVNSRKIPMTRAGATTVQAEIMAVNALGVTNGFIADDSPITVIAPDPLRMTPNMRAQRILGDFIVRYRIAGAVHKVLVDATLSI